MLTHYKLAVGRIRDTGKIYVTTVDGTWV